MKDTRKGQLNTGFSNILLVALIAILFIITLFIFDSMTTTFFQPTTLRVNNESSFANTSGDFVNTITQRNFRNAVKVIAINGSSGAVITPNVTLSSAGLLTNATAVVFQVVNLTYDYTYDADTQASNASGSLGTQFSNQIPLLGVLVAVVIISLIIGLLILSFFNRGGRA